MQSNYRRLGDYIREVKVKNSDLKTTRLLGINIDKYFMPSVANVVGTDMTNYRMVHKDQFACNRMHVGRDYRIPVALSNYKQPFIVSPAYDVFEVVDPEVLLPEYLMMWFSRKEFDRNAWFHTDGDVRGGLPWKSFCDLLVPIPSLEKQLQIIREYHVIRDRIRLNGQLISKLEDTARTIYKHWFVDFEFPDENGEPYKSSGGDMEWSAELGRQIPKAWASGSLANLCNYVSKKISVDKLTKSNYISTENMLQNRGGIIQVSNLPSGANVTKFSTNDILISNIRPYFKKIWLSNFEGGCSNDILCFRTHGPLAAFFLFYALETDSFFDYVMAGSNGAKMPRGDKKWIMNYKIVLPSEDNLRLFSTHLATLQQFMSSLHKESVLLKRLSGLVYAKMTTVALKNELV